MCLLPRGTGSMNSFQLPTLAKSFMAQFQMELCLREQCVYFPSEWVVSKNLISMRLKGVSSVMRLGEARELQKYRSSDIGLCKHSNTFSQQGFAFPSMSCTLQSQANFSGMHTGKIILDGLGDTDLQDLQLELPVSVFYTSRQCLY